MKNNRFLIISLLLTTLLPITADEVMVNTSDGETYFIEVDPQERLADLEEKIIALSDGRRKPYIIEFNDQPNPRRWCHKFAAKGGYLGYPRNYSAEISRQESEDIRYIVTKLAEETYFSLAALQSDLEAAGDRIDHIHPLRFLMTVFTDEKLKACIKIIQGRSGFVWNPFIGGIKKALSTEAEIGNMKHEFVSHFSNTVKININLILPAYKSQDWGKFVTLLIEHIPRKGDQDRFDD